MGTIFIDGIVYVDEDDLYVVGLLGGAVRIDAGYADKFEEVQEDRLGKSFEIEGTLAIAVAGDRAVSIRRSWGEALEASLLECRQLVLELRSMRSQPGAVMIS